MSRLLPLNSTPLERALATACDLGIDPEIIRGVADSARCPVDFLPWLAWAMSVEGWEAAETEVQQRALIRESIPVHKRKGTVGAVRRVLKAVGVKAEFKELIAWANDNRGGEGSILSPQLFERLRALVDATKNERSHYTLKVGARFDGGLRLANASQIRQLDRRTLEAQGVPMDTAEQALGLANASSVRCVIHQSAELLGVPIQAEQGFAVANAHRTRIVVRVTMEAILV
jgi:phage tail P2-like protein